MLVLQMPFTPVHWVLSTHSTHSFCVVLQSGFAGVQALKVSASHSTQSPLGRHAGSVDVGHAFVAPELKSPPQATHV